MNWDKIKEKYPIGYEKYALWQNYQKSAPQKNSYVRDLYDFFDGQGIHVLPYLDVGDMDDWGYDCSIKNGSNNHLTLISSKGATRPEAEANAFEKSFEILEERLI
jgi:hypothetical protein